MEWPGFVSLISAVIVLVGILFQVAQQHRKAKAEASIQIAATTISGYSALCKDLQTQHQNLQDEIHVLREDFAASQAEIATLKKQLVETTERYATEHAAWSIERIALKAQTAKMEKRIYELETCQKSEAL
jgi:uncharacterized protein YlxW (UPF0749 family)